MMKRYVITHEAISGRIVVDYLNGKIAVIRLDEAEINDKAAEKFLRTVPVLEEQLPAAFSSKTIIVPEDYPVDFEYFWKRYQLHRNRYKAEQVF
ncbi:MAG: hypothetical protein N2747_00315 [Chitinophagaceae bacterium]|nr:hypothetical protein [Chitinophagaceae bacterium]